MEKLYNAKVNKEDVVLNNSKRAFRLSVVAICIAIVITISLCLAWFVINERVRAEIFGIEIVDKAFSMQHIKINVDGEDQNTNEFKGLLPGSYFQFEVKLIRKLPGNLNIKMEFMGIKGDEFIGAQSGELYNMTQLFCVAPIDIDGNYLSPQIFFDTNINGSLQFMSGINMSAEQTSVTVFFMMKFSSEQIGYQELDETISKKEFLIDRILISLE